MPTPSNPGASSTPPAKPSVTSPMDKDATKPKRKSDEPTSPHHAEHESPAERAKTAMRKAGERAPGRKRRLKGEPAPES
jgi:hypothetical protein